MSALAAQRTRGLRVLIVDDHDVVQWGFRLMLGEQPWVERCLSARNAEEAFALARRYDPHVALVDLFVGQESGAEICAQLLALSPKLNVLLISGAGRSTGMGLRLAATEALQVGGIVEFGEPSPGTWRVRLAVPDERA